MPCRPSCLTTDRPHPARSRPPGNPSTPPHEPLKDACQLTEIRFRLDMQDEVEEWLIDLSSMMLTILLRYLAITSSRLSGLRGSPLACVIAASSPRPSARVTSTRAGHAAGCSWPKLLLLRRTVVQSAPGHEGGLSVGFGLCGGATIARCHRIPAQVPDAPYGFRRHALSVIDAGVIDVTHPPNRPRM